LTASRRRGNPREVLRAPWYSGMAQGLAASFFVRLAAVRRAPKRIDAAGRFVLGLEQLHTRQAGPWASAVDSRHYLWIEEYPDAHDHTLNGFMFAMFGVYEYWRATHSADAQRLFQGGVATLRHYLPAFRVPGHISYYCLAHHVQNLKYHRIHVWQMRAQGRMTGDRFFTDVSAAFAADAS
jgi:hypothetical protein